MEVINKLKNLIKTPKFWIIIAVIMFLIIAMISIFTYNAQDIIKCPEGQIQSPSCGNKCVPTCTNGLTYSCITGKCECPNGESLCGDVECCRNKVIIDGKCHCCNEDQVCPSNPNDPNSDTKCCDTGEICDPNTKTCVNVCGNNTDGTPFLCDSINSQCLTVQFKTDKQINQFKTDFANVKYIINGMVGHVCVKPSQSTCIFSPSDQSLPSSINDLTLYIPDFKNTTSNDSGICFGPGECDQQPYSNCSPSECTWYDPMSPSTIDAIGDASKNLYLKTGNYGFYCNPDGNDYVNFISKQSSAQCTVEDCWSQFANNESSDDIDYNEYTNICTIKLKGVPDDINPFNPCTDSTLNTCPSNIDTKIYQCKGGKIEKIETSKYKCVADTNGFPVCQQSNDPDAVDDPSCVGSSSCACPAGWTWYPGTAGENNQGCYKNKYSNFTMSQHDMGNCSDSWVSCSGDCSPVAAAKNQCGAGWTVVRGGGECSAGVGTGDGCYFNCKDTKIPEGTYYCDSKTTKYTKCDKSDCAPDQTKWPTNVNASGGCFNPYPNPQVAYCKMPGS